MKAIVTSFAQLVRKVQDSAQSDAETVAVLTLLLGSGRARFTRPTRVSAELRSEAPLRSRVRGREAAPAARRVCAGA